MDGRRLPLDGIRVLDLATVLAAPVTATMLGDFGADVVKVEEPRRGDFTRGGPGATGPGGRSLQWIQEGRNKRSVTVDLRTAEGQDLVRRLAPHFDVIVLNTRVPTLEKWDLTPERLLQIHPHAVVVLVTGYGATGPHRGRGAFDRVASAFSGLTHVSGEPDREPTRSGYAVIDYMAAYLAAFATVTALYHRDLHGGTGQVVDLGLYEAGFRASENALLAHAALGQVRERNGNRNHHVVPAADFTAADGRRISLHAGTDALFGKLAAALGRPELAEDDRYAARAHRVEHQDELYPVLAEWVARHCGDDAVRILNDAGVPAAPLMTIADIAADPHYRERGTITTVSDDEWGELPMVAALPRLSATPGRIRSLGPALGEHTDEILTDLLGLDARTLGALRRRGVI